MITDTDLNQLARETASELGIAGAQISLLHAGGLSQGVTGVTSARTGAEVTPETVFQIGSITKVLTAALVMGFVDEGAIELDVPVVEQLPGFALADASALETMTPRHLMSMTSGIENGPHTDFGAGDDALARYVAALAGLDQAFAPGQGFGYSNASTCVSGRLIEHLTGATWEEALLTRLLEPAELRDSPALPEEVMLRSFAVGHDLTDGGVQVPRAKWSLPRSIGPAGGTLCSTTSDLVRFAHVFMHEGRTLGGDRILAAETVAEMQRPQVQVPPTLIADWWGLGPSGKHWEGTDLVGHSGTNIGGSSYLLWSREHQVAVATSVNTPAQGYPFADRVFRELFGAVAGIAPRAQEPPPAAGDDPDLGRYAGTYAISELRLEISAADGRLLLSGECRMPGEEWRIFDSPLEQLNDTVFAATDPTITGGRGWGLAFVGGDNGSATHLMNGLYALPRIGAGSNA